MKTNEFPQTHPLVATHPGTLLRDEIEYRGISEKELAKLMKVDVMSIRVIIDGEKNISPEFALELEKTLGIDAYYWLRMQAKYDIDSLRIKEVENNPQLLSDTFSGSIVISSEPKSAYANLGKRHK